MKKEIIINNTVKKSIPDGYTISIELPQEVVTIISESANSAAIHHCDSDFIKTIASRVIYRCNDIYVKSLLDVTYIYNGSGLKVFVNLEGATYERDGDKIILGSHVVDIDIAYSKLLAWKKNIKIA